MERKAHVDDSFDGVYESVARKGKSLIDESSNEGCKSMERKEGWSHVGRSFDEIYESAARKAGIQPRPSNASLDDVYDSVRLERKTNAKAIKLLLTMAVPSKFDGIRQSPLPDMHIFEHPPYSDMDHFEYPPQPGMGNDFGSQIRVKDWPIEAKTQPLPTIIDPQTFSQYFEQSAYFLVKAFLADTIEGLSNPVFQVELQKLLMSSRKRQTPGSAKGNKAVCGRCALSQVVEEKALANIGFAKTATVSAWRLVSSFLCEETVRAQLNLIDDLLYLPPSSQFTAVSQCGNRAEVLGFWNQ